MFPPPQRHLLQNFSTLAISLQSNDNRITFELDGIMDLRNLVTNITINVHDHRGLISWKGTLTGVIEVRQIGSSPT